MSPGVGVASADPITDPLVTASCSYGQITAALNAQAPDLATMSTAAAAVSGPT